ncbi:MAG TPA: translation initiation factor IF-2, partial [Candidatus Nanoarchaeia archaeon]|nr:translation initiation factor IF-2 [Candidatus Nanoarchaeia archaeon]
GKSSIIERIASISITKGEPGLITQSIHSYKVSMEAMQKVMQSLQKSQVKIPGFLLIDSPGHAAFNNLRKRGGNLADLAVLVIDLNQGIQDQTLECIEILRSYKTPFVIAASKLDLIPGWHQLSQNFAQNLARQRASIQEELDKRIYAIVAKLAEYSLQAERFDRVDDFAKQVAIVPCSASTGEGLPELLMVLTGLAQKFLEKKLDIDPAREGRGTILEVNEEKGLGLTLDVVLYDGTLYVNDQVVIGTLGEPLITKVRGLFDYEGRKLQRVQQVSAATGVKIIAPGIKNAIGGMPLRVVKGNVDEVKQEIRKEVEQVTLEVDSEGIVVKADTLGGLEALIGLLRNAGIRIKRASIGEITKKDISEAGSENDQLNKVVAGFNVSSMQAAEAKVICSNVIYKIIEDISSWREEEKKRMEAKELEKVARAFKVQILPGCIFRQSNPAVVGVRVLGGIVQANTPLMKKDGSKASYIKSVQMHNAAVAEAKKDDEVALAIPDIICGRQVREGDVLYSDLDEQHFLKLKQLKRYLKEDEIEVIKEIAEIKRKENQVWGI